jgi:hypothetical protein
MKRRLRNADGFSKLQSSFICLATVAGERKSIERHFLSWGDQKRRASNKKIKEGSPMIRKVTFALLAATAAVSLASPAFAQARTPFGSQMPYYYNSSRSMVWGSWSPNEQSSTGSSQSKAPESHAQSTRHARGYNAFARHH